MSKFQKIISSLLLILTFGGLSSCTEDVVSKPHMIFKPAPKKGVVAIVNGKEIIEDEFYKEIEGELYEAESKVFQIKMDRLNGLILKTYMDTDPNKKNLTNDQFLDKYISSKKEITDKEIQAFIVDRNIPKQHVNDQLKDRVRKYLEQEQMRKDIDNWVATKTSKNPVQVFFERPHRPVKEVHVGDAPTLGNADAKVTIVEFSDFQCPYCAKGSKLIHEIHEKYGDKVQIAFKHFPLPFHKDAKLAAEASMCAKKHSVEKFWKLHNLLFENQSKLQLEGLKELAKKVGLDVAEFEKCLKSHEQLAKIDKDMNQGTDLGVKSTPTFFVNGQLVMGAQPLEAFSEIIDEELNK